MMEIALIENIQRENLNPIEEAIAFKNILKETGMTQEQIATKFGKSRSYITNLLGLLNLPTKVQDSVAHGEISMSHARTLSKISDQDEIEKLANQIINEKLNVRDIEKISSDNKLPKRVKINRETNNYKYHIFEDTMRDKIGTKVKISNKKIEIPFDSDKDLERILQILNINIEND